MAVLRQFKTAWVEIPKGSTLTEGAAQVQTALNALLAANANYALYNWQVVPVSIGKNLPAREVQNLPYGVLLVAEFSIA